MARVFSPPAQRNMTVSEIKKTNSERLIGEEVNEEMYVIWSNTQDELTRQSMSYPSANLKLNVWDGTCGMQGNADGTIKINTGTGDWWGCALEFQENGKGENLSGFQSGRLHFEMKGHTKAQFEIGFQTGLYANGTQVNNGILFGENDDYSLSDDWQSYAIPISELEKKSADLTSVTSVIYFLSSSGCDGKSIKVRNIFYTQH